MELNIREIQLETLKIMKIIDKVCSENNLKYSLFYGTLIGAIRHKGFIPWDDDLDIVMPRRDYDKLEEFFIEHEAELYPYKLFSYKNNDLYPYYINRICNVEYELDAENEKKCGMGTFIDIYPFDGAGDGNIDFVYKRARFYSSMYYMKSRIAFVNDKNKKKNIVKRMVYFISKFYSLKKLQNKLNSIAHKYSYEDSKYVTCLVWGLVNNRPLFKKEDIEECIRVPFEDANFLVSKNYHNVLTACYGDYMQLPPEEERIGHHFYKIIKKME